MKLKSIVNAVRRELNQIKLHATDSEINKLIQQIDLLVPTHQNFCVYGLMTGGCFSTRAEILITKCASINKFLGNTLCEITRTGRTEKIATILENSQVVKHRDRRNKTIYYSQLETLLYYDKDLVVTLIKEIFKDKFVKV